MPDTRALELINAEIDGELRPDEQAELDMLLESSADLQVTRAELQKLAHMLESVPEQTPPADLADRILGRIELPTQQPAFSLSGFFSSFQLAPMAVAFAAGLLVTVGVYEMTSERAVGLDTSSIVGTMVAKPQSQPGIHKDSMVIKVPGASGTVVLTGIGNMRILNFDLDTVEETEIVIALAEANLDFGGIARAATSGTSAEQSYQVSDGTLRMINQGHQAFSVFLLDAGAEGGDRVISIGILSGGAPAFSGTLRG
jgi:hypothetical protein